MLIAAISTGHKIGLGLVGLAFVAFALTSSFLLPRLRPQFPGKGGVAGFTAVCVLFFCSMLAAVWFFGKEAKEAEAGGAESAPAQVTTVAQATSSAAAATATAPATTTAPAAPAAPQGDPAAGKELYAANGCAACHTFKPAGSTGKVGPDLDNLAANAEKANRGSLAAYTAQSIKDPGAYVVPGYPNGVMPSFASLGDGRSPTSSRFLRKRAEYPPSHPAALRTVAGPPARAAERAPRRTGRDLGEAGGLQLGSCVRRQQDPQTRVPRRGRARAGLRHARLDRRCAVQPHAPGRGGRRTARARLRSRPGALGRVARLGVRQGRKHPPLADHGRRRAPFGCGLRHRIPAELGGGDRIGGGVGRQAVRDSRRRVGRSARRAGLRALGQEVAGQESELGVFFDSIVVCSVTGSTQAGMLAGFAAQERDRSVLGIDGSATVQQTRDQIARIARSTAKAICVGRDLQDDEIVLLDEWHAGTYGIPDAKTIEAIRLCARLEGMLTDPVYEGKSMAALIDLVRDGRIKPGSKVLYAHLGGQPALNAYAGAFRS